VIDAANQLVLTNAHVAVGNDGMKAQVGNDTSTTTPVRLVAASPCDDLAVVKLVDPVTGLRALPLGTSSTVKAGDQVTVLGFPGSFQSTSEDLHQASTVVTNTGSVSATHVQATPDPSYPTYQDTIQHQAPTNHGNSGGPLLNAKGQVIGINTLGNPDAQGQYYSISIDYAKRLLSDLEAGKSHALVGWNLFPISADDQNLQDELNSIYSNDGAFSFEAPYLASRVAGWLRESPPTSGLYNFGNQPGSSAEKADVSGGFLMTSINGNPVKKVQDVCDIINSASPGETLRLRGYNIDATNNVSDIEKRWTADLKVPVA
jgi:S1-C subfamily serine protease